MIDATRTVGVIDRRLFGSFIEHMGRAVYGGIYEPGHPTADADGWRHDVIDLTRRLGVTTVRYPGGNFVSGYTWEDGVGPRDRRPERDDLAWRSTEPNLVGTDDFVDWARLAGVEPMLAVNLGSRGADAARDLVEYCNAPGGTVMADRRVANGHAEPHRIRTWCLGNEMDGPWQIGYTTAVEYGRRAAEAARAMRAVDPTIELVACGSSGSAMPTFGSWETTVLELAGGEIDHISLHAYYDPATYETIDDYLACSADLDRMIRRVAAIVDADRAARPDRRPIGISVDEWNVWHLTEHRLREAARDDRGYERAPALAEDTHDLADALVVGCLLITLLRHVDRVSIACLAQLVNVIPAIRTVDGGPAWLQASAYPFADVARGGRGTVLELDIDGMAPGAVGPVEATAVHDGVTGEVSVFAVNRAAWEIRLDASLRGFDPLVIAGQSVLTGPDLAAHNTAADPYRVIPRPADGATITGDGLAVRLPARSWNVVRLAAPAEPPPPSEQGASRRGPPCSLRGERRRSRGAFRARSEGPG
ncbi:MAG: alpha-N-arabinofuranosidase [Chloroflexota bacterium]